MAHRRQAVFQLRVGPEHPGFTIARTLDAFTTFAEFHLAGSPVTSTPAGCSDGRNPPARAPLSNENKMSDGH